MLEPITKQELIDASADALALEQVVNGTDTSDVTSRLARTYPTLAKAMRLIVENGLLGATPFNLKSSMESSALANDAYAVVTDDPTIANNGFYQKQGGAWEFLAWNPVNQAKAYADANRLFKPFVLAAAADFNTLIVEGRTVVPTTPIAAASTNIPNSNAGVLDVALVGSGVFQVYRVFQFDLAYERQRLSGGTWTDWVQSASKDMVDTVAANTLDAASADAQTKATAAVAPLAQYTTGIAAYRKIDGRVEVQLDSAGVLRVVSTTAKTGERQNFDPTVVANTADIKTAEIAVFGVSAYKKIAGLVQAMADSSGVLRIISSTTTGELIVYSNSKQKTILAGENISVVTSADSILISAGATPLATPTEFVLCLIIGQSNASYFGGDAAQAPVLPDLVCRVWDNTYSVLRDVNDGSEAATTCKQTFAPALALEFYKQTGMGLIVVNSAVGSSAQVAAADSGVGNWDTSGTLRQTALDRFNACKTHLNTNNVQYQSGFVCWLQGEQDSLKIDDATITKAQYAAALSTMVTFFKTNLGSKLPFVITRIAYRAPDTAGYQQIRAAQMEAASNLSGVFMGYTGTYRFLTAGGLMADNVHYNQTGKNLIGTALGKITSKLSAGVN